MPSSCPPKLSRMTSEVSRLHQGSNRISALRAAGKSVLRPAQFVTPITCHEIPTSRLMKCLLRLPRNLRGRMPHGACRDIRARHRAPKTAAMSHTLRLPRNLPIEEKCHAPMSAADQTNAGCILSPPQFGKNVLNIEFQSVAYLRAFLLLL